MLASIFARDRSHLSIKHKTFDLFGAAGARPGQLIISLLFWNISKHVDLCYEIFILGNMLNFICFIEI